MTSPTSFALFFILFVVAFLPSMVATSRRHHSKWPIIALNTIDVLLLVTSVGLLIGVNALSLMIGPVGLVLMIGVTTITWLGCLAWSVITAVRHTAMDGSYDSTGDASVHGYYAVANALNR